MHIISTLCGRRGSAVAAIATVALSLAACTSGPANGDTTADGIGLVKSGKLTVCTKLPYKPFEFQDNGKVVGFDVDLMDLFAKDLKVERETVDIDFQQIWSGAAFAARKCDLGASGITITQARQKTVAFSDPYFDSTQALIVPSGSAATDLAALKGKKVGVITDTTGQEYAKKYAGEKGYTVVVFEDHALMMNAVKAGNVDAVIDDNGVARDFTRSNPDTKVVTEFDTGEQYGVAAKKDDPNATKLLGRLNAVIGKAKSDGTYGRIYEKWMAAKWTSK
ncbi:polar amino acid transport system substrate-binding protein [Kibdelosporangium banguiense]|uniref:Polar amino acid transport system substrate-binding protein n=1 Tax=Kibdelosporangium banguiense TaxID=1365924 RepID=A0ABS4TXX4_9PSEU|nr:ABC transporter substrate-binding protein [Kibdelosporangium banguiense]MBP2329252.1 polar amino acid transport system substrate-binding protein [Kibdelosporangium banguiense]